MATLTKVWEITDKGPAEIPDTVFAVAHKESELEDWIAKDPKILGEDMIVLDRQREISGVGRLDLLLMDASGKLVIVELKRDVSPREAVAQALDYASWLDDTTEEEIRANAGEHLGKDLDIVFEEHFHTEPPEWVCQNHRILIVAARLDASAERIVNYLAERHHVDINAIFFSYAKLSGGMEVLVRSVLVAEDVVRPPRRNLTVASLISMATEHGTATLVEICRKMRTVWREVPENTAGGSFRYWSAKPEGGSKMVFGVNTANGLANAPNGELDVWVRTDALAEVTGIPEEEIRKQIADGFQPFNTSHMDFVIRLKSSAEAERLITVLLKLAKIVPDVQ